MVDDKEKKDCCGCRACEQICPKQAIEMVEDEKGFRYPKIDYDLCSKCGLCDKVCAFDENYKNFGDDPSVYAVKNRDEEVRSTSTSGGMFYAISDFILEQGGVVYGAGFKDRLYVCHKRAETKQERDEFKGSKYVQSDIGRSFILVKRDLDNGLKVLFTGTPCQVVALKSFLRRDYDNLTTVDFVCHGTPSNKLWQEYLDVIEKDTRNSVVHAEFRNKDAGWHIPRTKLHLKEKGKKRIKGEQSYLRLFYSNCFLMPSCYNCKFTNFNRASDITIGDFWGIEKSMPDFDDNRGISLVLVNSEKGRCLFESIKTGLIVRESCKENCLQEQLESPAVNDKNAVHFWDNYQKRRMRYVMTKYTEYSEIRTFFKKTVRKIRRIMNSYLRKVPWFR